MEYRGGVGGNLSSGNLSGSQVLPGSGLSLLLSPSSDADARVSISPEFHSMTQRSNSMLLQINPSPKSSQTVCESHCCVQYDVSSPSGKKQYPFAQLSQ